MNHRIITSQPWDTEQIGVEVAALRCVPNEYVHIENEMGLIREIETYLSENRNVGLVTCKVSPVFGKVIRYLFEKSATYVNVELSLQYYKNNRCQISSKDSVDYKFLKTIESDSFSDLSGEMTESRWFYDSNIPSGKADGLWKESIKNHCSGFADELCVAYVEEVPAGLAALKFSHDNQIHCSIVLVRPQFRRGHIGSNILKSIFSRYQDRYKIFVEVLATNQAAINLYTRVGFNYNFNVLVIHWWRDAGV